MEGFRVEVQRHEILANNPKRIFASPTEIMNKSINIPQTQIVLAFVATCVEATARTLGVSYREVFMRMKRLGMIENYILPNYGVLHTESRENVALDMIEYMKLWEAKL